MDITSSTSPNFYPDNQAERLARKSRGKGKGVCWLPGTDLWINPYTDTKHSPEHLTL